MKCLTPGCQRERLAAHHAHCQSCESRLLREAFGPVAWHERAATNTLPPLVVGGVDLPAQPRSAPPRLDQAAELTETELRYAWGDR